MRDAVGYLSSPRVNFQPSAPGLREHASPEAAEADRLLALIRLTPAWDHHALLRKRLREERCDPLAGALPATFFPFHSCYSAYAWRQIEPGLFAATKQLHGFAGFCYLFAEADELGLYSARYPNIQRCLAA